MAEESESTVTNQESLIEKISETIGEKIHGHDDSSSSSDSDSEKTVASVVKEKVFRLFGREKPVHSVLGGGKPADVLLWRNKKISGSVLGGATAVWIFFELLQYHLLTLVSHILILLLAGLFLWSNVQTFIHKKQPHLPIVHIPEEPFLQVAAALRIEINRGFSALRDIGAGKDLKKFLIVIAGLWVLSIVGSWFNFITLFYITFVLLHTVPVVYDKYEDKIDPLAEKAFIEIKKHYAVFDEKVLSKIPKSPLNAKKLA